jgi:hypothetical protein
MPASFHRRTLLRGFAASSLSVVALHRTDPAWHVQARAATPIGTPAAVSLPHLLDPTRFHLELYADLAPLGRPKAFQLTIAQENRGFRTGCMSPPDRLGMTDQIACCIWTMHESSMCLPRVSTVTRRWSLPVVPMVRPSSSPNHWIRPSPGSGPTAV